MLSMLPRYIKGLSKMIVTKLVQQRELAEAQAALQAEIDAANAEEAAEEDDGEGEAGEVPMPDAEPVEQVEQVAEE